MRTDQRRKTKLQARPHAIGMGGLLGMALLAMPSAATAEECTQQEANLIAGQTLNVGNVNVCNDAETLTVTYEATYPWCLVETNLQVATDPEDIPRNPQGHPRPDQFEDGARHDCEGEVTFAIPLADIGEGVAPGESVVIAARAVVDDDERQEGAWGDGTRFVDRGPWATYFFYTTQAPFLYGDEDSRCVFVTSSTPTGDLDGLAGADAIFQDLAEAQGSRAAPGTYATGNVSFLGSTCESWTRDTSPSPAVVGFAANTGAAWSSFNTQSCSFAGRLYCFQQ